MSATFVNNLRARRETIDLAGAGADAMEIRVEVPEVWDVVRIRVSRSATATSVKTRALEALAGAEAVAPGWVLKHRGWEILDESQSLADLDIVEGSTLLLTSRRRRPVR